MEQLAGWKPIVEAVTGKGTVFVSQLWHVGRRGAADGGGLAAPACYRLLQAGFDRSRPVSATCRAWLTARPPRGHR